MSKKFDDDVASLAGDGGRPTTEACVNMRDYLLRHNRKSSVRIITDELKDCNWDASIATVQRRMRGLETGSPAPEHGSRTGEVVERKRDRKKGNKKKAAQTTQVIKEMMASPVAVAKLAEVVVDTNTSTMLAIRENRNRMAVNIIIAEMMAAKPELLLLDMRGTAALVDALTSGTKLSGGHAIDISIPTDADRKNAALGVSPEGHPMKDVTPTPVSETVTSMDKWLAKRKNGGEGA